MTSCRLVLGLMALFCGVTCSHAADAKRPNIVLIFSDDYGIPGVGCYGGKYATPHLDKLAAGGLRFEHCYAMPLCGPSRAVTLSGRYPFRHGVTDNNAGAAYHPSESPTIAKLLQEAGYKTALAGKWRQLQHLETAEDGRAWGFDEFLAWGMTKGERYWQPDYLLNGKPLGDVGDKYGPDLLHEFVVDFIRRHKADPFFVYYPTPLVHGPILHTPDSAGEAKKEQHYADNVAYLDKLVGKLVAELDTLGLRQNTLVVFTGDNGSTGGDEHLTMANGRRLDGQKGTLKEGGSRVPLIVNWPGVTPPGRVLKDLVDFSDFYVTFAEVAGVKLPSNVKLDGRSFAPQIRGETGNPRESIFVQLRDEWYARDAGWKLDQSGELFSMRDAPFDQIAIPADTTDADAVAAKKRLRATLDELNPAGGEQGKARDKDKKAKRKAKKQAKNAQ